MDPTEDLSARVLLRHILSTEPPRTPITRSVTKAQRLSATRRSRRLSTKDTVCQTPQDMLRRSLRQRMRESITAKSLPLAKRRTAVQRESTAAVLMSFDDEDTPRHILKNILMTEPVRSPVVHRKTETEEPQPSSANSSLAGKNTSELSGLDLPDLTMGIAPTVTKGLSRKRRRHSLNATAFEKRLKGGDDVGEESELWADEHSSLSLSRSTSLSLKTPFADVQTEKRGLQRRVSNRRKITEEEFGAAVNRIEMGGSNSSVGPGPSDTTYPEGFTLGLSTFSEPDVTTDIVQCGSDRGAQSKEQSRTGSHDKEEESARDPQTEESDGDPQPEVDLSARARIVEEEEETVKDGQDEGCGGDPQPEVDVSTRSQSQEEEEETARESHVEGGGGDSQPEVSTGSPSQEEEETALQSHVEGGGGDSQPVVDVSTGSQSQEEEEEETARESHSDEECGDPPAEVEVSTGTQSQEEEEEETARESHVEGGGGDSQPEVSTRSQSQEEEEEEEETARESHSDEECGDPQAEVEVSTRSPSQEEEEETARESHTEDSSLVAGQSEEEEDFADDERNQKNSPEEDLTESQAEAEELEERGDGHVSEEHGEQSSHRARCSGGDVVHATEPDGDTLDTGCSEDESKAQGTFILPITLGMGGSETAQPPNDFAASSTTGQPDVEDPEDLVDKENCSEGGRHHSSDSPAEGAAGDSAELEDESESEDVPSKTPAFVRRKRVFSQPFNNVQPSGPSKGSPAKSKQVRKTPRRGKRQEGLPKSYLMNVFKHFAKTKVSADIYPVLNEVMNKFLERMAEDLETYAAHAKRKTIEVEDAKLLLKRQGHVNDKVPVEVLIEKYLRLDQRKLLIPIATSGNVVIPKK